MRNMSFYYTQEQARAKIKDVTRRDGWWSLKPGMLVQQVVKSQGLKKGEVIEKIHVIKIVDTRPERIYDILEYPDPAAEIAREGFPDMTPGEFIEMLCEITGKDASEEINRIEFKYV